MLCGVRKLQKRIKEAKKKIKSIQKKHKHIWKKEVPYTPSETFEIVCTGCLLSKEVSKTQCCPNCFREMRYKGTHDDLPNGQEVKTYECPNCGYLHQHKESIGLR